MICDAKNCTGCGLCTAICPKQCITLQKNEYGSFKYSIDEDNCIHCGKCQRMCPQNAAVTESVKTCYAGWAEDPQERQSSSSGGIAAALYRSMLQMGGAIVGACYENGTFRLKLSQQEQDIETFKGSKYVNCDSRHIYREVKEKLDNGIPVLFVGTPCQVAAIKSYAGDTPLLYTVDLICHGTPPQALFQEHFQAVLKNITSVNFRDRGVYRLRMDDADGKVYRIDGGLDAYYLAFIHGVTFSDCCYACRYAGTQRVADITIGDFWGLDENVGREEKVERISCVLCNTQQGEKLLQQSAGIHLIQRELSEAIPKNEQLVRPFQRSADRQAFEKLYPRLGFEKTIRKLGIEKIRKRNLIMTTLSNIKKSILRAK